MKKGIMKFLNVWIALEKKCSKHAIRGIILINKHRFKFKILIKKYNDVKKAYVDYLIFVPLHMHLQYALSVINDLLMILDNNL